MKTLIPKGAAVAAAMVLAAGATFAQETLTLGQYLARVEQNNASIRATDLSIEAMGGKVREADMVYSPFLSAGYNYTYDRSGPGFGSTLPTDTMTAGALNVGLSKKFQTGSNVTLGYTNSSASFDLLAPTLVLGPTPLTSFNGYQMKPFVRLEQSLLRDFGAGLTQAGIDKAKQATRSGQYMQLYRKQQMLLGAQSAYWGLSLAREDVAFRKASLERAEKLLAWSRRQVNLDLADKGDLYQAEASYKLRQLNLQTAIEGETRARQEFNTLLGKDGTAVDEELAKISDVVASSAKGAPALTAQGSRADVLAARASYESSKMAEKETHYRALPELSLSGQYSLTGIGLQSSDAWNQVAGFEKPAYSVGLSLIVPLDYGTLTAVRRGYKNDFESAGASLKAAETSARADWDTLVRNWNDVNARLALGEEIRVIQEKRLANEQNRFERGRSTTFQLITAENDLDDATLNVYRLVFEKLITGARAELYHTQEVY